MRAELGIPESATVFGRLGGYESFDVDAALTDDGERALHFAADGCCGAAVGPSP